MAKDQKQIADEVREWLRGKRESDRVKHHARELLAVLEEIIHAWESIPERDQVNEEMNDDEMWRKARVVVAKAKGEASPS